MNARKLEQFLEWLDENDKRVALCDVDTDERRFTSGQKLRSLVTEFNNRPAEGYKPEARGVLG